jgi:hypothetical protein
VLDRRSAIDEQRGHLLASLAQREEQRSDQALRHAAIDHLARDRRGVQVGATVDQDLGDGRIS